jgi:hypothetical protein
MKKKLVYYGGDGYEGVREKGKFEVRYGVSDVKKFTSLLAARNFYAKILDSKALLDVGGFFSEMLECHTLQAD